MPKHRVAIEYRGRFGIPRKDVRVIEADDDDNQVDQMTAIADEIDARYGRPAVTSGHSEPA